MREVRNWPTHWQRSGTVRPPGNQRATWAAPPRIRGGAVARHAHQLHLRAPQHAKPRHRSLPRRCRSRSAGSHLLRRPLPQPARRVLPQGRQAELGAAGERLLAETTVVPRVARQAARSARGRAGASQRPTRRRSSSCSLPPSPAPRPRRRCSRWRCTLQRRAATACPCPRCSSGSGSPTRSAKSDLKVDAIRRSTRCRGRRRGSRAFVQRRRTAAQRLIVTKDVKTHLLLLNCPTPSRRGTWSCPCAAPASRASTAGGRPRGSTTWRATGWGRRRRPPQRAQMRPSRRCRGLPKWLDERARRARTQAESWWSELRVRVNQNMHLLHAVHWPVRVLS